MAFISNINGVLVGFLSLIWTLHRLIVFVKGTDTKRMHITQGSPWMCVGEYVSFGVWAASYIFVQYVHTEMTHYLVTRLPQLHTSEITCVKCGFVISLLHIPTCPNTERVFVCVCEDRQVIYLSFVLWIFMFMCRCASSILMVCGVL